MKEHTSTAADAQASSEGKVLETTESQLTHRKIACCKNWEKKLTVSGRGRDSQLIAELGRYFLLFLFLVYSNLQLISTTISQCNRSMNYAMSMQKCIVACFTLIDSFVCTSQFLPTRITETSLFWNQIQS